jgi:hypothetical protein
VTRFVTPVRAAAATLVVAAAIQLIPVRRTNPPVTFEVDAPKPVLRLLQRACYDCHSNRTRWPWYSHVAPVSWLIARDVHKGRKEVNFTEWPTFDFQAQDHIMAGIAKQVDRGRMPLAQYIVMHPDAELTPAERQLIVNWARSGEQIDDQ